MESVSLAAKIIFFAGTGIFLIFGGLTSFILWRFSLSRLAAIILISVVGVVSFMIISHALYTLSQL